MSRITDRSKFRLSNFRSTGIHDDATSNTVNITDDNVTVSANAIVTGTKLTINNADITSDGSSITLPAGSTVSGEGSVADRMQVANTQTLHSNITANLNSYIANTNPRITNILSSVSGTNTAIRSLVSDRMQVANTQSLINARLGATSTVTLTGDVTAGSTAFSSNAVSISTTIASNSVDGSKLTDNITIAENLTVSGNLTISGTTTTVNTETINLADNTIKLNSNLSGATAPTQNAGIAINRGSSANVEFVWDETNDYWTVGAEDLFFGDNAKAIFGAGSDLQIYHEGTFSIIEDSGTGNLLIRANDLRLQDDVGAHFIHGNKGSDVKIYHPADGTVHLATTSGGIDVTGTVTADGLTVNGDTNGDPSLAHFYNINTGTAAEATAYITNSATKADGLFLQQIGSGFTTAGGFVQDGSTIGSGTGASGGLSIMTRAAADMRFYTNGHTNQRMRIASSGDVSLYDSTGSSQGFFWDASTQRLGLGTTSPDTALHISSTSYPQTRITNAISFSVGVDSSNNYVIDPISGTTRNIVMQNSGAGDINVGIGTASPNTPQAVNLHISGTSSAIRMSDTTNSLTGNLYASGGEFSILTSSSHPLVFKTNNSEAARIDSSGNVGIGTSNPVSPLVISNGGASGIELHPEISSNFNRIINYNRSTSVYNELGVDAARIEIRPEGVRRLSVATSGVIVNEDGRSDTDFRVESNNSTHMLFVDGGNDRVGIGTSSPARKMQIDGSASDAAIQFTNTNTGSTSTDGTYVGHAGTGTDFQLWNYETGYIRFGTSGSEAMRITSGGDVGIGTTNPSGKLQVQTSHSSTDVTAANTNSTLIIGNSAAGNGVYNALKFSANQQDMYLMAFNNNQQASRRLGFFVGSVAGDAVDDERLSILGNGNVGIGTASPAQALDVDGNIIADNFQLRGSDTANNLACTYGYQSVSNGSRIVTWGDGTSRSGAITFDTGGSESMRLDSSGNLGIGKTPSTALDVNGTVTAHTVEVGDGSAGGTSEVVFSDNVSGRAKVLFDHSATPNEEMGFEIAGTRYMTIENGGNVGIGTASPATDLDVAGNILTSDALYLNSLNVGSMAYFSYGGGNSKLWNTVNGALLFGTNNSEAMRITSSGNVGIGTTSPTGNANGSSLVLEVHSSSGANPPEILAGGQNAEISIAGGSTASYLWSTGAYPLVIATNASEKMRIDSSGRVAVGTTTPHTADSLLTLQNSSGSAELNITSGTSGGSVLNMGDTGDFNIGRIKYDQSTDSMQFNTNNAERVRITSGGDVAINNTSSNGFKMYIQSNSGQPALGLRRNGGADGELVRFFNSAGTDVGSIDTTASATSYNTSSDYRLKENVVADWDATTRLKQLNPVRFNFIADANTTVDGFLAHEVQSVVPEAITGTKDAVDADGNPVYQGIDQSKLVPLLVKTIQELEARIAALEAK